MNQKQYIRSRFEKILKESIHEKAESIMNRLNLKKETDLYDTNEFDYVQEGEACEQCGSEMTEKECMECGWKGSSEVMEFEDDIDYGNTKYGLGDDDDEEFVNYDDINYDDEEEYYPELRIPRDMPSYKTKYRYSDDEEEMTEKECMECGWKGSSEVMEFEDDETTSRMETDEQWQALAADMAIAAAPAVATWALDKVFNEGEDSDTEQLYEVEFEKEVEEGETDESREFAYAAMMAKKQGKKTFELDGETFDVKESYITEKWKGDVEVKQTGEYSDMSIAELNAAIKKQKAKNDRTKEAGRKVSHADKTKMSQLYFAKRAKQGWKGKGKAKVNESILFTETDLIDFIEKIVNEDKKFRKSEPKGFREYERVHKADKKENEDYLKSVAKKMTDYLKNMNDKSSKYEMKETQKFPTENGGKRKKYTPSDAVDEYIDAFSYPGQTNLVYDEIKPNEEWIEDLIKGSSRTGNAQVDKDGNALGNVVPSDTGEKFFKNYKDNLYGQEQQEASYKRQPQPVDQAGEHTERGSLKSKRGKKTSQSVLNKLEENVNEKETKKLNEEFERIQDLMGYNRKTQ